MSLKLTLTPGQAEIFKLKALAWAADFEQACCLESNGYGAEQKAFDTFIAAGADECLQVNCGSALTQLDLFIQNRDRFVPGFISYDLKNEIEELSSGNHDGLHFPDLFFFVPSHQLLFKDGAVEILSNDAERVVKEIEAQAVPQADPGFEGTLAQRFDKESYTAAVEGLQQHIRRGDIYEVNFCQEFYAENAQLNPLGAYLALNRISPTPFANFFKNGPQFIISATPERFLSRKGNRLISQPIKGTAKRGADPAADVANKQFLLKSEKERSENVMIVDLVRNDLTRCALPGSVKVDELFGIYTFPQVHQMISTISCELEPQTPLSAILSSTFPMGSMTGAPKITAMQLIESFEKSKRGVYSGSVGYVAPDGNFDFNVIIRTILYNAGRQYLSFQVGSAITHLADAEQEFEECLLKAKAIFQVLGQTST